MNRNSLALLTIFSIFAISMINPSPILTTAYAQQPVPEQLEFMIPVHTGLTEVYRTISYNAVQILGAVIILAIGYVVGRVAEKASGEILSRLTKFGEEHMKEAMTESKSFQSQIKLIPTTLKWFVYIIFIIASVNALGLQYLSDALETLWLWIPQMLGAVVVLILGTILVRFIDKWLIEKKFAGSDDDSVTGARTIIKIVIYGVVVAIAITQLGVGTDIIPTLVEAFAWGIAGAFALAVGLAGYKILPKYVISKDNERMGLTTGNSIVTVPTMDDEGKEIPSEKLEIIKVGITKIKVKTNDGHFKFIPHDEFENTIFGLEEKSNS